MMRLAACGVLMLLQIAASHAVGTQSKQFETGMSALLAGDYAEAYCHWKPLAERGNAEAQYHIAWLYANGNGLAVDVHQALDWWLAAARQGHADAQFAVGLAYTTGEGMDKDLDEAVRWYLAAARQGHQDARDILVRLNGDPGVDLLESNPEITREAWFGWEAQAISDGINARAGPGTDQPIVGRLEEGARVRVIGSRGDWLRVVLLPGDGTDIAWIYKSLVSGGGR